MSDARRGGAIHYREIGLVKVKGKEVLVPLIEIVASRVTALIPLTTALRHRDRHDACGRLTGVRVAPLLRERPTTSDPMCLERLHSSDGGRSPK